MNMFRITILSLATSSLMLASAVHAQNDMTTPAPEAAQAEKKDEAVLNHEHVSRDVITGGLVVLEKLEKLAKHNFTTIIDLRTEAEDGVSQEKTAVTEAGMTYVHIPVTSDGATDADVQALSTALDAATGKVVLHCKSGNRAGAIWTRYRLSKGIDAELAFAEGRKGGMKDGQAELIKKSCNCDPE